MIFKKASKILVIVWMCFIFSMSHLDGAKSWFLTGEFLTVAKTGSIDSDKSYEEKMALYDGDEQWDLMVFLRKSAHFFEYFVLSILLMNAFLFKKPWKEAFYWALGMAIAYAVLDEFHQVFIPGRSGNAVDVAIDAFGALCGLLSLSCLKCIRKAKNNEN